MSGLASAALPKQTSHRETGGSSPMEPSSSEMPSGSASRTLPCAVPAGIETATGSPLKINLLVCSRDQIREETGKKNLEIWERGYGGGWFCHCYTTCHRESETVKKGWRWGKKLKPLQYCGSTTESSTWGSTAFSGLPCSAKCLFCPSFMCSIVVSAHSSTVLQKWGFFRYRGILSQLEATVGEE